MVLAAGVEVCADRTDVLRWRMDPSPRQALHFVTAVEAIRFINAVG